MSPSAPELPRPAELNEVVGAYRLERVIGQGSMGCVYEGVHETLDRRAAVKIMYPWLSRDDTYTARLRREAQIVNDLRHPNVIDIFDFVRTQAPTRIACVMELLEGPTLAEVIGERRLTPLQALNVAIQLGNALAAVHQHGVVHRDLKPANVGVVAPLDSDFGAVPSVKLLDFGIAKVADPTAPSRTMTAALVGTPAYMAPEQVAAEPATGATDVYALMEVLVEMLTQRKPFDGDGLELMRRKLSGDAPEVRLPDDVVGRPRLEALILAGLAIDPVARPLLSEILPRLRALAALQGSA